MCGESTTCEMYGFSTSLSKKGLADEILPFSRIKSSSVMKPSPQLALAFDWPVPSTKKRHEGHSGAMRSMVLR